MPTNRDRLPVDKYKQALSMSDEPETGGKRTRERFSDEELAQIKKDFSKRLKEAFGNVSNAEIARRLGVPDMTVKAYVDGDRLPAPDILIWIHLKSGASIDWLLTGRGTRQVVSENVFTEEEEQSIHMMAAESKRSFNEMVRVLATAMLEAYEKI